MTEVTNDRLLEKAKELAQAANAATGTSDFNPGMLSVYSEVVNAHGNFVVQWTATLGKFTANAETMERVLKALEDRIARHASMLAQG